MTSPEDPEERIRQLEQSAASYGAVELGAEHAPREGVDPSSQLPPPPAYNTPVPPAYAPPPAFGPPPPPYGDAPSYGDPYQPPFGTQYTPIQKKGAPVGLIIGLVVFVFLAVFGAIAAFVWNMSSTIEGVAGGGGSVDRPNTPTFRPPTITLPSIPAIPTIPSTVEETPKPGGQFSVAGVDNVRTIPCNDSNISVSGVNNTITLTGHCLSVTVSGVDNNVTVDSVDTIGASGFDNEVIYHSGDPKVDATGSNTVSRG
ncbi:membrane protein [Mycolicibacterium moriokaense]|uniref:Membrane protein n=1 Tax=Mycolicibacterium moriokaense TaxID=39691 RepID=A0AAD1HFM4_9MYCO|nr:DUF3060 domain-containing protein [Mycolicibacterium moriokaense]MCV7042876.1 DUF3060 domain-containing protein [Mycolicibacterium moriokaense]BBX04572.1 membrane protein [Mycolicibacterium moriokaense]